MLFNSIDFLIFLPIVFTLYWFLSSFKLKFQNSLLLISSYFFYSCWDVRFLFLLLFSTVLDYYSALKITESQNKNSKKVWFVISVTINLGLLGVLKYYNFFVESFSLLLSSVGLQTNPFTLQVILPVGISFYTFHGLSYLIDVYKERITVERNFIDYSLFVSFFPLLVAGPIERATHLLPQIKAKRLFNYYQAVDGLKQILWGLFKKVVIADNCAEYANLIFNNSSDYSGSTLVLGAIFFSFQIYGDFSGYSDIALGTAKLFGINLLRNFAFPYFSRDIAEFWRRWHISLSSWFRDYLYIPIGGSKGSKWIKIRNTFVIFIVSGFWHGANWTFIVWGALNALFILPLILSNNNRNNIEIVANGNIFPSLKELFSIIFTFTMVVFAWIFFRAENISHALTYIFNIFNSSILLLPQLEYKTKITLFFIFILILIEWIGREEQYGIEKIGSNWYRPIRWVFYSVILFTIGMFMSSVESPFIYFQF